MDLPGQHPQRQYRRQLKVSGSRWAFSLVELMVAMAVFAVMMGILLMMINQSAQVLQRTQTGVGSSKSARFAFNLITRTLSQSRISAYQDYDNPSQPTAYLRKSDLHFVVDGPQGTGFNQGNSIFFQAPMGRTQDSAAYGGLPSILNSVGYYVSYGKNPSLSPFLQQFDQNRFRLMQFIAPAENMNVFVTNANPKAWYQDQLASRSTVIADNVILVLFWPRLSKEEDPTGNSLTQPLFGSAYRYDSRLNATQNPQPVTANQQPPLVQVTLVAIDETAALRLSSSATPPLEISTALQGLFTTSTEDAYTRDMATLESRLTAAHITYRTLSSMVPLRETKWNK